MKMNTLPRDVEKVMISFIDIEDIIGVLDAGIEENIVIEVLPTILQRRSQTDIERLIHDLINKNYYQFVKCIFNRYMNLISVIILHYVVEERTTIAENLLRIIPEHYDWELYNMDGAFQNHTMFEKELKRELRPALATNCLPLLNIILKEYDYQVGELHKQKLEQITEVRQARIKVSIYNLTKYWGDSKNLFSNDKVETMDELLDKMKELNL